jgi:hypothetical protein
MSDKIISIGSNHDFINRLNLYVSAGANFTLEVSNYVQTITYNGKKYMYCINLQSEQTFAGYNLIKSNLSKLDEKKKIELDKIIKSHEASRAKYYSVKYALIPQSIKQVICIDINSAYATILFNTGFIEEKTFKYLQRIKKGSRLAAVGMIASLKNVFIYEDGEIINVDEIQSEYRNLFFYLVNQTGKIMEALEKRYFKAWLFTWVDGIYFDLNKFPKQDIQTILGEIKEHFKVEAKIEFCRDFNLNRKNQNILFDFEKHNAKKNKWEKKTYNFPDPNLIENVTKLI